MFDISVEQRIYDRPLWTDPFLAATHAHTSVHARKHARTHTHTSTYASTHTQANKKQNSITIITLYIPSSLNYSLYVFLFAVICDNISMNSNGTQQSAYLRQGPTVPFRSIKPNPISNSIALYHSKIQITHRGLTII